MKQIYTCEKEEERVSRLFVGEFAVVAAVAFTALEGQALGGNHAGAKAFARLSSTAVGETACAATVALAALEGEALASAAPASATLSEASASAPARSTTKVLKRVVNLVRIFAGVAAGALAPLKAVALVVGARSAEPPAAAACVSESYWENA